MVCAKDTKTCHFECLLQIHHIFAETPVTALFKGIQRLEITRTSNLKAF